VWQNIELKGATIGSSVAWADEDLKGSKSGGSPVRKIITTAGIVVLLVGISFLSIHASKTAMSIEDQTVVESGSLQFYQEVRFITLAVLLLGLVGLLWGKYWEARALPASRAAVRFRPRHRLQGVLGPSRGFKRWLLLIFLPGLGQAAVGRTARAAISVLSLCMVWIGFYYLFSNLDPDPYSYFVYPYLPVRAFHITALLSISLGVWTLIAADAIRLNEPGLRADQVPALRVLVSTVMLPLIPVVAGFILQLSAGRLESHDLGRLTGWSGACAGLSAIVAWKSGWNWKRTITVSLAGLLVGGASQYLILLVPVPRTGMILYRSLIGGGLVGLSLLVLLKGREGTVLVLPAVISASWFGVLSAFAVLQYATESSLRPYLSISVLKSLTFVEFYFPSLAALLIIQFLSTSHWLGISEIEKSDVRIDGLPPVC